MKVTVNVDDIATLASFMAKPLSMPTSSTIADWLMDPDMREASEAAKRVLAALKESPMIECPACGATVPVSADDVVAEHNKGDGPCVASGWTIKKGSPQ